MPKRPTSPRKPAPKGKTTAPAAAESALVVYGPAKKLGRLQTQIKGFGFDIIPLNAPGPKPIRQSKSTPNTGPRVRVVEEGRLKGLVISSSNERASASADQTLEGREILARVEAWAGSKRAALTWFRSQPIAALGDQTAEGLVRTGQADLVRAYLDQIAAGGCA